MSTVVRGAIWLVLAGAVVVSLLIALAVGIGIGMVFWTVMETIR